MCQSIGDWIKKIEYTLTYFTGPDDQKLSLFIVDVSDTLGNGSRPLCSGNAENLGMMVNIVRDLDTYDEGIDRFEELYKYSPHAARFTCRGTASSAPVDFKVRFFILVEITGHLF